MDLIKALATELEPIPQLIDLISAAMRAFNMLRENRNLLVHGLEIDEAGQLSAKNKGREHHILLNDLFDVAARTERLAAHVDLIAAAKRSYDFSKAKAESMGGHIGAFDWPEPFGEVPNLKQN
ncbi:hypothetical protein ABIB86_000417 [Bradyrhizobium sp. JR1.7]|uniref:hypothetical protein n=1 Tax=unclassified Bradyrhizobium TaxID=2631580 RepID=UPI003396FB8B